MKSSMKNKKDKKVVIVGFGVVGSAMVNMFYNKEVVIYDKFNKNVSVSKKEANEADLAIICVPTSPKKYGEADTSAVEEVMKWCTAPLILIKSTVPPGTTDYLKKKYKKRVCFSPEYIGESKYHTNYKYPHPQDARTNTFFNIGGDPKDCSAIWEFFKDEMCVDTRVGFGTAKEAELAKYMENSFFATKITFCNEYAEICAGFDTDYNRVRELWLNDPRINPMHTAVFMDERGFGGRCFPKDVSAIVKASKIKPVLLQAVIDKNSDYARD